MKKNMALVSLVLSIALMTSSPAYGMEWLGKMFGGEGEKQTEEQTTLQALQGRLQQLRGTLAQLQTRLSGLMQQVGSAGAQAAVDPDAEAKKKAFAEWSVRIEHSINAFNKNVPDAYKIPEGMAGPHFQVMKTMRENISYYFPSLPIDEHSIDQAVQKFLAHHAYTAAENKDAIPQTVKNAIGSPDDWYKPVPSAAALATGASHFPPPGAQPPAHVPMPAMPAAPGKNPFVVPDDLKQHIVQLPPVAQNRNIYRLKNLEQQAIWPCGFFTLWYAQKLQELFQNNPPNSVGELLDRFFKSNSQNVQAFEQLQHTVAPQAYADDSGNQNNNLTKYKNVAPKLGDTNPSVHIQNLLVPSTVSGPQNLQIEGPKLLRLFFEQKKHDARHAIIRIVALRTNNYIAMLPILPELSGIEHAIIQLPGEGPINIQQVKNNIQQKQPIINLLFWSVIDHYLLVSLIKLVNNEYVMCIFDSIIDGHDQGAEKAIFTDIVRVYDAIFNN